MTDPARSFGRVAHEYELGRPPSWPPSAIDTLDRLVHPSPPDRRYQSFAWRDALAGPRFEELQFAEMLNRGELDRAELLARIASWSQVATLPDDEREAFLSEVAVHLIEPTYVATLETHLYWTRLAR